MTDRAPLRVADYRDLIDLDTPVSSVAAADWGDEAAAVLATLGRPSTGSAVADLAALNAELAPLEAGTLDAWTVERIEQVLVGAAVGAVRVDPTALPTVADRGATADPSGTIVSLWVGDITRLAADAVVNAANSSLLGCRIPYHFCIDYALHAGAGPRLRSDCDRLIEAQGHLEPVGSAKITRAYALPSRYVLHTVGPQLRPGDEPTVDDMESLRSCYRSCLDTAAEVDDIRSVAFCAISTGVFAFPKPAAAELALRTVGQWLERHRGRFDRIVFNLFSESDAEQYRNVLGIRA